MWPFTPRARPPGDDASELHGLLASGKQDVAAPRSGDAKAKVCGGVEWGMGKPTRRCAFFFHTHPTPQLLITGMHCTSCASAVEGALR